MPRARKVIVSGMPYFVTFRTEEGLPFPPNPLINQVFLSNMAMAQQLYPVDICHYIVMANHMHLILIPKKPRDYCNFIEYLKRETAHAVNRLLGRRRKTVWCHGYDSPILLDSSACRKKVEYIYLNPFNANLVKDIKDYPGLSSWRYRGKDKVVIKSQRIPRRNISPLKSHILKSIKKVLSRLLKLPSSQCSLTLKPNAWLKSYYEEDKALAVCSEIDEEIKRKQNVTSSSEEAEITVMGRERLENQPMSLPYLSKKYSPKMICLGVCKRVRQKFISWFKERSKQAYKGYQDFCNRVSESLNIPEGMFAPGRFCGGVLHPKNCPL